MSYFVSAVRYGIPRVPGHHYGAAEGSSPVQKRAERCPILAVGNDVHPQSWRVRSMFEMEGQAGTCPWL